VDKRTRQRWRGASIQELREALEHGEITEEDHDQLLRERSRGNWVRPVVITVLVTVGLMGLGLLIFCGGCALVVLKPH
jgi:hypothetical protein